jgi:2-dehydropantoate 2-reductase
VESLGREILIAAAATGMAIQWYPDAAAMKWSKLVANLVANATSALLDMEPAAIYANPALFKIERAQLREALAAGRARGWRIVDLPGAPVRLLALATALPGPVARLALSRTVSGARGGKDPSLRVAVRAGGPTEVAWLNGAVERVGRAAGVPTPVNTWLARLVEEASRDPDRRAWFRQRPDRLVETVPRR